MCHPAQALVAELLTRCSEAGDIYKADYNGFYCVDCEEYKVRRADEACTLNKSMLEAKRLSFF